MEWPPFPKERLRPTLHVSLYQFIKDMTVTTVRLLLQNAMWQHAPVWIANKTLKGTVGTGGLRAT